MLEENHYKEMSLLDFQDKFFSEEPCLEYLVKTRWPSGVKCSSCGSDKLDFIASRRLFECRKCHKQVYVTAGTIFHKSKTALRKWFWMIFLLATSKKGISMLYLQKQLGIGSYRTAWLMAHKIRKAMSERNALYALNGTIEIDEILIGGVQTFEDKRNFGYNKTPFLTAVQEDNNGFPAFLSFEELESICNKHIISAARKTRKNANTIKSDGRSAYLKLPEFGYKHERLVAMDDPEKAHKHLKWVNIIVSNLKRYLLSTHHGVFPKYRSAFLTEFAYRFNRRHWPHQAFDRLLWACLQSPPAPLPVVRA